MVAYRPFFLVGLLQLLVAMALWGHWLAARLGAPAPAIALPPAWWHAGALLYGSFSFFVMGFTLTATPNWLGERPLPWRRYALPWAAMTVGVLLADVAAFTHAPRWNGLAWSIHWLGWAGAAWLAWRIVWASRHPGKRHFYMAIAVIVGGLFGELCHLVNFFLLSAELARLAKESALWLFLTPTFFSISHRVVPFFTRLAKGEALPQPLWQLPAFTLSCWGLFAARLAEATPSIALLDAALLAQALLLICQWRCWRHLGEPLIGVHHLAMLWLPVALALMLAQDLGAALGLAPLHALVVGHFGTMLLGMAARVTVAHGGGPLRFPPLLVGVFFFYQLSPLLRLAADLPLIPPLIAAWFHLAAAAVWLLAWLTWAMLLLPRLIIAPRDRK